MRRSFHILSRAHRGGLLSTRPTATATATAASSSSSSSSAAHPLSLSNRVLVRRRPFCTGGGPGGGGGDPASRTRVGFNVPREIAITGAVMLGTLAAYKLFYGHEEHLSPAIRSHVHMAASHRARGDAQGAIRGYEQAYEGAKATNNSRSARLLFQMALNLGDLHEEAGNMRSSGVYFEAALGHAMREEAREAREGHGEGRGAERGAEEVGGAGAGAEAGGAGGAGTGKEAGTRVSGQRLVGIALTRLSDSAASDGDFPAAEKYLVRALSKCVPEAATLLRQGARREAAKRSPMNPTSPLDPTSTVSASSVNALGGAPLFVEAELDVVSTLAAGGEEVAAILFNLGGLYVTMKAYDQALVVLTACYHVSTQCRCPPEQIAEVSSLVDEVHRKKGRAKRKMEEQAATEAQ